MASQQQQNKDLAITTDIELAPAAVSASPQHQQGAQISLAPQIKADDPFLVEFAPADPANPLNWPSGRKWAVTDVLSATGFNRIMVSTIMAPALGSIAGELAMTSTESVMALSIYLLATAFGPLVIGPLSEIYGRQRVLHASNLWFLLWNLLCGFATRKELLIGARFLAGFGASAVYALAGGVLGDVWRPEERGRSLGVYQLIPVLGAAVGPIIGGFMAARTTWRWMFWATSIFQAVMILVSFTVFQETYAPHILQARAARLRRQTGESRYQTARERLLHSTPSPLAAVARAMLRPVSFLALHPVVQITAVLSAFNYGILYIVLSSFAGLWTDRYGEPVAISGLHYLACALGEMAGSQLGGPLMDRLYVRMRSRSRSRAEPRGSEEEEHPPEFRIPLVLPATFVAQLGLFVYGWMAEYRVHWTAVDAGVFLAMFGFQMGSMPLQAYVIDAYREHTSSALAASQFLRSLTAFLFPLFTPSMYRALGYGWANTLLGLAGLVLGVPSPLILWFYGARLRARRVPT